SGIGRAAALAFAREGARVAVADVAEATAVAAAAEIRATGGEALALAADVASEPEVAAMVARAVGAFGRIDCAFNNAGIGGGRRPLHEWDLADFRRVLDVNLTGVWLCLKYELGLMAKQGGGAIVNNASVAGLRGSPELGPYVASKHGVIGLTRVAAAEYAPHNVRVNAVCPGWTDTPILADLKAEPELMERLIGRVPVGRLGRPEEVAAAVLWLCSDAASFAVGHAMVVDGGLTA
ncbi:MAG TPA: SDR family oxidoreductase, partial [Isosphaeraceae bacterium]|nr:SDR family oxidoreductase [Isosphaeraceae bacterium]